MYHSACACQRAAVTRIASSDRRSGKPGSIAAKRAEPLRLLREFRTMNPAEKRPVQIAARTGQNFVQHGLLFGRGVRQVEVRQTRGS